MTVDKNGLDAISFLEKFRIFSGDKEHVDYPYDVSRRNRSQSLSRSSTAKSREGADGAFPVLKFP